jgi:1,6-anhydro-N-acetylmuramate kinase
MGLFLGLISGTSMDAIDAARARGPTRLIRPRLN